MIGASAVRSAFRFIENTPGVVRAFAMKPQLAGLAPRTSDELVVVGTGPSLRDTLERHFGFLTGKSLMCVNEFAHTDDYVKLRPDYYVLTDPAYWRRDQAPAIQAMIDTSVDRMARLTSWKMTLLINSAGKQWNHFAELPRRNPNIDIAYFRNNGVTCRRPLQLHLYKAKRAMPLLYNTLSVGIFLGLNIGYKTVYLVGADHNWHEDIHIAEDNQLFWRNAHFNDEGEVAYVPMWVDGYKQRTFRMHEILHSLSLSFQGYVELEEYSRYLGARVYNASERSYIDAFERYRPRSAA
jgi:hypothetical protein